jgi:hypothetical protein
MFADPHFLDSADNFDFFGLRPNVALKINPYRESLTGIPHVTCNFSMGTE